MHFIHLFFAALLLAGSIRSIAQQKTFNQWTAVNNVFKINNLLGINFDGHLRTSNQLNQISTILLRPGLNVTFKKKFYATVGYAFIASRRSTSGVSDLVAKHRIWQQLQLTHPVGFTALTHRLRFEQRFIPDYFSQGLDLKVNGYDFATRLRYFVRDIIPLNGQKGFQKGYFAAVQNEIFINTGDQSAANGKYFDQNRVLLGLGRRLRKELDLEVAYVNQYVNGEKAAFSNNHIVQISSYLRL